MNNKRISTLIIIIQCLDIFIHLFTNQFELIRVLSNGLVIAWVILIQLKVHTFVFNLITTITLSIYIILNGLFLLENGIVNPNNQSLRIALFIFVLSTIILVLMQYIKETYERKRMLYDSS